MATVTRRPSSLAYHLITLHPSPPPTTYYRSPTSTTHHRPDLPPITHPQSPTPITHQSPPISHHPSSLTYHLITHHYRYHPLLSPTHHSSPVPRHLSPPSPTPTTHQPHPLPHYSSPITHRPFPPCHSPVEDGADEASVSEGEERRSVPWLHGAAGPLVEGLLLGRH